MKMLSLIVASLFVLNLAAEPLPPPEKEAMTLSELEAEIINLDGKIIELKFNSVISLGQIANKKYFAVCLWKEKKSSVMSARRVFVTEEGKEFFQELIGKTIPGGNTESIYLQVISKNPVKIDEYHSCKLKAVGTRYKKSKGTYSW